MKYFLIFISIILINTFCNFVVDFKKFNPTEEFRDATTFTFSLIEKYIELPNDIYVEIFTFPFFNRDIVADSNPKFYCFDDINDHILLPVSLYAQLYNVIRCGTNIDSHITINFNMDDWIRPYYYFKTDGHVPFGYIDFVTILLHEIIHGLGFGTGFNNSNGYYRFHPNLLIYDYYIFGDLIKMPLTSPFPLKRNQLSLLTNEPLFFKGNGSFQVYTPSNFITGRSISHVAKNGLMNQITYTGTSKHCLTEECIIFFRTVGYNVKESIPPCISSASTLDYFKLFY